MVSSTIRKLSRFAAGMILAGAISVIPAATAGAALEQTGTWGGPGVFNAIGDLAVGPDGAVGVYDPALGKARIFTADGELIRTIDGPQGLGGHEDTVSLDIRDDGTTEIFDRVGERLYRFDSEDDPVDQIDFDIIGNVRDFSPDPRGGYIAASGEDLKVTRFDGSGNEIVSWPTGRVLGGDPWGGAFVEIDRHDEDDRVYVASGTLIGMFSRSGESWAAWSLRESECRMTGTGFLDLALDDQYNVYVLASLSSSDLKGVLYKFDTTGNVVWREPLDPTFKKVAVGPDGSVYLAGRAGAATSSVYRFDHIHDPDAMRWGKCPDSPPPPPPGKPEFKLLGFEYGPGRTWARAKLRSSQAGLVSVSGKKILRKQLRIKSGGIHRIQVKVKPRYLKPARPRRKLKLLVNFSFSNPNGEVRRKAVVHLRGKLRKSAK